MTEFKKGDRVLVEGSVIDARQNPYGRIGVDVNGAALVYVDFASVVLAPDQPLKEGDQVYTLAGSLGFIRAVYKDEAYVVLLNSSTRLSVTCPLSHLRCAPSVDVTT